MSRQHHIPYTRRAEQPEENHISPNRVRRQSTSLTGRATNPRSATRGGEDSPYTGLTLPQPATQLTPVQPRQRSRGLQPTQLTQRRPHNRPAAVVISVPQRNSTQQRNPTHTQHAPHTRNNASPPSNSHDRATMNNPQRSAYPLPRIMSADTTPNQTPPPPHIRVTSLRIPYTPVTQSRTIRAELTIELTHRIPGATPPARRRQSRTHRIPGAAQPSPTEQPPPFP